MWFMAAVLLAAVMLIADVNAVGRWIVVIAAGIAMVGLEQRRRRQM
jgi:hypothetical protein